MDLQPTPRRRRPLVFYGMVGCCSRLHEPPPSIRLQPRPTLYPPPPRSSPHLCSVLSNCKQFLSSGFPLSRREIEKMRLFARREKLGSMNAELVFELQWRKGIYWRCKIQRLDQRRSACSVQTFTIRIMPLLGIERGVGISDLASMQC